MQIDGDFERNIQRACDSGAIPGAVVMAATRDRVIYRQAFGKRDLSGEAAMTEDSVFWIASMTKAITATAAMQLVERGKLSLDGPIGAVLPDLADVQVLEGFDDDGRPKLRPARGPITLRQLLTHTAGFCYDMMNADMGRYLATSGTPAFRSGLNAAMRVPLMTDPGTRWEYGTNIDFVGKAVEAASGQRLDEYFRTHILDPLGMADTAFVIGEAQRRRLVRVHRRQPDQTLEPIDFEIRQDPEFFGGGGGLYGTAPDYIKFTRMILGNGTGNGQRLLKPETVALMSGNHIGDLHVTPMLSALPMVTNDAELCPGIAKKHGLSFVINMAPTPEGRSAGSLAWAGLANTYYWIDPVRDVSGVIMMQVLPFADRTCLQIFSEFERAVYAGLEKLAA